MRIVRRTWRCVIVTRNTIDDRRGVVLLMIDDVFDRRFVRFVMGGQRAIDEPGRGEQPALAVGLHDERRGAVVAVETGSAALRGRIGRFGRRKIGDVEPLPAPYGCVPPDVTRPAAG